MQPRLQKESKRRFSLGAFKGLCLRENADASYLSVSRNLCADDFPSLTPRKARGIASNCESVTAMCFTSAMCWLDGTRLYYNSVYVGELSAGAKQFAHLGERIVIYPDKLILDTSALALLPIENTVSLSNASAAPSHMDGTPASETSYVRLSAERIGSGFKKGDCVSVSGFANPALNGDFILQTVNNDFVTVIAVIDEAETAIGSVTVKRSAPDLDFILACNNRIWGVSNAEHQIYACKLGDPTNWNVFEGLSTDSYAAKSTSAGEFTGATEFLGGAVFFKENEITRLSGTRPGNFRLVSYDMTGVMKGCADSLAFAGSRLYYKGVDGVYRYDGGVPENISRPLGDGRYTLARAGAVGDRYYISLFDTIENEFRLFVFDTQTGVWHGEDAPEALFFAQAGDKLLFKGADGAIYCVNGHYRWLDREMLPNDTKVFTVEPYVRWQAVTHVIAPASPDRMYATDMHLRFTLPAQSTLKVEIRYAGSAYWHELVKFTDAQSAVTRHIPIKARRADGVYVRLSGVGRCSVTALSITFEKGGDIR